MRHRRRDHEDIDPRAAADNLSRVADQVEALTRALEGGGDAPAVGAVVAERAARQVEALLDMLDGWCGYFAGYDPLLWENDFAGGPEDRIGMLFWRMHRAARIIFPRSYHLGRMTPEEAVDFLVDRVGHERANAEA